MTKKTTLSPGKIVNKKLNLTSVTSQKHDASGTGKAFVWLRDNVAYLASHPWF